MACGSLGYTYHHSQILVLRRKVCACPVMIGHALCTLPPFAFNFAMIPIQIRKGFLYYFTKFRQKKFHVFCMKIFVSKIFLSFQKSKKNNRQKNPGFKNIWIYLTQILFPTYYLYFQYIHKMLHLHYMLLIILLL